MLSASLNFSFARPLASVMIEGGAKVNWTALATNIVDKVFLYYAPKILAGSGSIPFATGAGPFSVAFSPGGGLLATTSPSTNTVSVFAIDQTTGALIWIVGLVRLVWRHRFAYLPPFPQSMPKLQQWIAKANEYGLYALLFVQPITGLGNVLFHGRPFQLLIWEVPALLAPNPAIRSLFVEAHEFGAKALLALIGLHAGAALFHRLVLRDGVLQRMLPWSST